MRGNQDGVYVPRRLVFILIGVFVLINIFFLLMGILIGKDDLKWNERANPDEYAAALVREQPGNEAVEKELAVFDDEPSLLMEEENRDLEPDYLDDQAVEELREARLAEPPKPVTDPVRPPVRVAEREEPRSEQSRAAPPKATAPRRSEAPAPSPESLSSGFWVQVLAGSERDKVESFRQKVSGRGYSASMVSEGGMFKVQVGPYRSREAAVSASEKLTRIFGVSTWIRQR
ncbi:SPOR domain-containing protein [Sulfidibacter corallicola]|uniref:SPOR domain-containing protein n=1 Tax=Sulfidibacter corallicola TaxID=2818388 RepID=A0A8A4TE94_SULCO|nr:SPOR domain-containing protein [Sulfidibacter corallicola]QTD47544.1 SPOR domain-containing protein [Sulfidibacter corallicola]